MRVYSAASEEALRARGVLREWAGDGLLEDAQYQQMEKETQCDLRRTNVFLRLVLFFFTLIIVGAAVGLFFLMFLFRPEGDVAGVFLLIFAAGSYAGAEFAASQKRLHRHGIEEALLLCSVGFVCAGILAFSSGRAEGLAAAIAAVASIWIWHRFGLAYTPLAAMLFVVWLSDSWGSSATAQHLIVTAIYGAGLIAVGFLRPRHRLTYLDNEYSIAEAMLWLGIYLAMNLQISSAEFLKGRVGALSAGEIPHGFYWTTFVLIWCLPPIMLARGLRQKDRYVIIAGVVAAILTLITNKSYLGWERHTWDPMLLGVLLMGTAQLLRRWLATGPDGVRHGFTAQRLSGKNKRWMSVGTAVVGVTSPIAAATPSVSSPDTPFGGGASGGGGASSDF